MSIESFFDEDPSDKIKSKIRQRRAQMLVHSCLYYEMDTTTVSDDVWQKWADELTKLQNEHPDCCNISFYDKEFEDWTGDSGAFLPVRTKRVREMTLRFLRSYEADNENR